MQPSNMFQISVATNGYIVTDRSGSMAVYSDYRQALADVKKRILKDIDDRAAYEKQQAEITKAIEAKKKEQPKKESK